MDKFSLFTSTLVDWARERGKTILYTSLTGLLLLFLGFQLIGRFKGNAQADYIVAEIAYEQWKTALESENGQEGWDKFEKPLRRHPELHAKFDALIAQRLLERKKVELAAPYANATLGRLERESPYYAQFAKTSLLVAKGNLSAGLEEAKKLKEGMLQDTGFWEKQDQTAHFGSLLFAYNLLRIAMLEKEAGTPHGEWIAWEELQKNAGWTEEASPSKTYDPEAYHLLAQNFQIREIALLDFIKYRQGQLSSLTCR